MFMYLISYIIVACQEHNEIGLHNQVARKNRKRILRDTISQREIVD